MADRTYPQQAHSTDNNDGAQVRAPLRDESDGTYSPAVRARLEVWDAANASWIRAKANPNGALLLDRGTAGADISAAATYTAAQTGTILVSVATDKVAHVTAVIAAYGDGGSATPNVTVSVGSNVVARHPGLPAGGGIAVSDIDLGANAGDDITVDCGAPTGSSLSVTVHYYMENA